MSALAVRLVNPLPRALGHYAKQTRDVFEALGIEVIDTPGTSIELGGAGAKARTGLKVVHEHLRRTGRPDVPVLVLWPALGYLEEATWLRATSQVAVVVHDPEPLRSQLALSKRTAAWTGLLPRGQVATVALSTPAHGVLSAQRNRYVIQLPHPIRRPGPPPRSYRDLVTTLGQYKPSRDLAALFELGDRPLPGGARRLLAGRGWPNVTGWERREGFLSESDLQGLLQASQATVIPYKQFFQSNIAVRALEDLTPVVAPRHPMLEELLGPGWVGLVDTDRSWQQALTQATTSSAELESRREAYWEHCLDRWGQWWSTWT